MVVKLLLLFFWVVTLCGLVGRAEVQKSMVRQNVGIYLQVDSVTTQQQY
jgi:hypothetical protein